jgi:hypothetical protein
MDDTHPTTKDEPVSIEADKQPLEESYSHTADEAAEYFRSRGFRIAPRTISWHCQTNLLDCRKFTHGNVLKWKITKQSLDERIETLKREGNAIASNNRQEPASLPAGNSEQQQGPASELATEIINVMRGELEAKNKQIAEFQSIMKDHNQQFENLNQTIQLSNETIQQLNKTLALPQVKEVMVSMNQEGVEWREGKDQGSQPNRESRVVPNQPDNQE